MQLFLIFLGLFHVYPRLMYVGKETGDALMRSRTSVRTGGTAHMQNHKTEELVRQAKRQDADAFTELMQLFMKNMYKTAYAILMNDEDAADAIQDTILICWEKLKLLRHDRYFKTWMIKILINRCYDMLRKKKPLVPLEEWEEPEVYDDYNLEWKEALAGISDKYRIVLILFYGEGYHINEIAKILKRPPSTIRTQLARGRKQLKQYYLEAEGS